MSQRLPADLLLDDIDALYTVHRAGDDAGPRRGDTLGDVGLVGGGAVAALRGEIVAAGAAADVLASARLLPGGVRIDCSGKAVVPGLVDAHTHALFAQPRAAEFARRLAGESYPSIAQAGGGIRASVRDFRALPESRLRALTRARLRSALRYGTTTIEVKSGYGLDLEQELKALRALRAVTAERGLPRVVATCLAAHEFPDEWQHDREGYVQLVCSSILPQVAHEGLAERVDVFCEPGVFTPQQSRAILLAARELGLRGCVHADELAGSGGAELAAELGADSADHLGRVSPAGILALARSRTVGVLLPGTIFSLGLDTWAPAREMIGAGVALALATDFNPGSCYCESLPLVMAIACTRMHLSPAEALVMGTLNAAWAVGRAGAVGSLTPGKRCDLVVLRCASVEELIQHLGQDEIDTVVLDGRIVGRAAT
jgi:imidazolonepropionase